MNRARASVGVGLGAAAAIAGSASGQVCPPEPQGPGSIPHIRFVDLIGCAAEPCAPDINGDGEVDVFDLLEYLDAWFAADPGADLTGDTMVDVFDLLEYLDAWFAGCA